MMFVEMKRNFKTKDGYTRITMEENPFAIKIKHSLCYPAMEEGKFVEYVQNTYEVKKDEANSLFLKYKKQGFEYRIEK